MFWASAAIGWGVIGWGLRGALHHHIDTRPTQLSGFLVGGALIHDLVFAPLVLAAGVGVSRFAPQRSRAYVQAALIVSGCLVLFAYPEVRDYARVLHNPTSLPYNYSANVLIAVATVWVGTAIVAIVRAVRRHHTTSAPTP